MMNIDLKIYKMFDDVTSPVFASKGSACFDLHAYISKDHGIQAFNDAGSKQIPKQIKDNRVVVYPNERLLIPTGIIMDIPVRHSVRLHARSGNAFKKGLTLANGEGIIDNDYVEDKDKDESNNSNNYLSPSLEILDANSELSKTKKDNETIKANSNLLEKVFDDFNIVSILPISIDFLSA